MKMNKMRGFFPSILVCLCIFSKCLANPLDFNRKNLEIIVSEDAKTHDFSLPFKVAKSPLIITKIETSCGCTVAAPNQNEFNAGDTSFVKGSINDFPEGTSKTITLNILGKLLSGGNKSETFSQSVDVVFAKPAQLDIGPKVVIISRPYENFAAKTINIKARNLGEIDKIEVNETDDKTAFDLKFSYEIETIEPKERYALIIKSISSKDIRLSDHYILPLIITKADGSKHQYFIHILAR